MVNWGELQLTSSCNPLLLYWAVLGFTGVYLGELQSTVPVLLAGGMYYYCIAMQYNALR